ncbi:MAG: hypothetical protein V1808_01405 [Candidatus Daviesbacteria bacterium]
MRQSKIYLDSNIWIQYLWVEQVSFCDEFNKDNKDRERSYKFVKGLTEKSIPVISSLFINAEISGYFRDYLRFRKSLTLGFDFTNSHKYKQHFRLLANEKKEINSYLEHLANLSYVEVVKLKGLDATSLDFFEIATCEYELEYMDTIHLIVAMSEGCEYLITGDKDFRNKGNKFLHDQKLSSDIRIINIKEAEHIFR